MKHVRYIYQLLLLKTADLKFFFITKYRNYDIPDEGMFTNNTMDHIVTNITGKRLLEYGSGGSTKLFAKFATLVTSIESDKHFANLVSRHCALQSNIEVRYANIGPTKSYGQPLVLLRRIMKSRYERYVLNPWEQQFTSFDVILVDGRFRVACAMQAAIRNPKPFLLIVDDYSERPTYAVISEALGVHPQIIDKTAFFHIDNEVEKTRCLKVYDDFRYDPA